MDRNPEFLSELAMKEFEKLMGLCFIFYLGRLLNFSPNLLVFEEH